MVGWYDVVFDYVFVFGGDVCFVGSGEVVWEVVYWCLENVFFGGWFDYGI